MTKESAEPLLPRLQKKPADQKAWKTFFGMMSLRVTRSVTRLGADPEAAKDILQEVFIAFIRLVARVESDERAEGLLLMMARRRMIDWHRKNSRSPIDGDSEDRLAMLPADGPDLCESEDALRRAARATEDMTDEDRDLLGFLLAEDGPKEIAEARRISYTNAATKVARLRARLRDRLEPSTTTSDRPGKRRKKKK